MKKLLKGSLPILLVASMIVGCSKGTEAVVDNPVVVEPIVLGNFTFDVDPATFEIMIEKDGVKERASLPLPSSKVSDVVKEADHASWTYPEQKVKVNVEKKQSYLDISIESIGAEEFQWPKVNAESYMLPLWEGKYIPSKDNSWREFLKDETFSWSESFSMNFFALNKANYSIVYVLDNMFNNSVEFDTAPTIDLKFTHEFPSINADKSYGFRLYVTDNDPVQITQVYKQYTEEQAKFKTLAQKAEENPNIEKLYGAPHIYLWNENIVSTENINWSKMKSKLDPTLSEWISQLLDTYVEDGSGEFNTVIKEIKTQDNIMEYQRMVILRVLNQVIKLEQFYSANIFKQIDSELQNLIDSGIPTLSEQKLYVLNKGLLKHVLGDAIDDIEDWGKADSTDIIDEMKQAGITNAWIGLPNWANGLMNPSFVEEANKAGYLIAPYDSYHSIQEKEDKSWNTAYFEDKSLFEDSTITKKNGEKVKGFLGRGQKLNPTLALPSVKQRVNDILQDGIMYNSWFVDADATGEIYDDYSPEHITTQEQDMNARLERMEYLATEKQMVAGSETGNDFASRVIAYAHGLETPVIKWSDADMRSNKESEYYVGAYYSPKGTIPEKYTKQVPIKEQYKAIYTDPTYDLPLYKLVYNNSVITTHHWEWGSFKIKDQVVDRMLYELLYNVPPLYHLDKQEWSDNKDTIINYLKVWAPFHRKAVTLEMTGFNILSADRLVQSTEYGDDLKVVANFSASDFEQNGENIPAKSVVIYEGDSRQVIVGSTLLKK